MTEKVKVFMCTHKAPFFIPPLCIPVQGGAKINPPISGVVSDHGENGSISDKNPYYCELTVQYYAWKNCRADYYGFCHYRRYFCFDRSVKRPYLVFNDIPDAKKDKLLGNEELIANLCFENDVIVPRAENIGSTVYKKYVTSEHCFKEDLDLFLQIVKDKHPCLSPFADEYMKDKRQYFCNMFIMKRDIFENYCEMLFSVLEELDSKKTLHGNFQDDRTDGYLAERFLGIYLLYLRAQGKKIYEISRIDVKCSRLKRIIYKLFPPETKRRFLLKLFWHS